MRRWGLLAMALAAVASGSFLVGREAPPKDAASGVDLVVSSGPQATRAATIEWTMERFRNAEPLSGPDGVVPEAQPLRLPSAIPRNPGLIPGSPPEGSPAHQGVPVPQSAQVPTVEPLADSRWYSYPGPYSRYLIGKAEARKWPTSTVGALFFTVNGIDARCSGAVIAPDAIWTAGHCVHEGPAGGWHSDFAFVPAYNGTGKCPGNGCPYGVWTGNHAWTLTGWIEQEDFEMDMGGVVLNRTGGKSIGSRVGHLGFAWYWPYVQHYHLIGYPVAKPFNGKRMVTCQASTSSVYGGVNPALGVGCDMTKGASGGPFVLSFRDGDYVNGNVSFFFQGKSQELFSPYFGDCARALQQALALSTPGSPADTFWCDVP